MSIGKRIKGVRKSESLTLERFGERIGIKQSALSQIESGRTNPSEQTIRSICREFKVSEAWLREGEGEMYPRRTREEELTELVGSLMADRPESFRRSLVTVLLRFRPDGPEWEVLERIYASVAAEAEQMASRPLTPEEEIEAEVESYRRQLLAEKKARASSASSPNAAGGDGGYKLA